MARYGFFIDLGRCVGCQACTVACQNVNALAPEVRLTKVCRTAVGDLTNLRATYRVQQCLHCDDPPCVAVCPTGATYKSADGPVLLNAEDCIGCRYCTTACPYDARTFDAATGKVAKCSMCFSRVEAGESTACVATCLGGARISGDLDDPDSAISAAIRQPGTVRIGGTSMHFKLPPGWGREVLPPDLAWPAYVYPWQSILQPLGQLLLGGAAAAVAVSFAANLVNGLRERGSHHEDQPDAE